LNEVKSILNLSYGLLLGTLGAVLISFMLLHKTLLLDFGGFLNNLPEYTSVIVTSSIKAVLIGSIFTSYMIIDSYWAPMLGDGTMAALGYAQRILGSVGALSIMAVYVVTGREAQVELTLNGIGSFRKLSIKFIKTTLLLSVILAIFLFIFIDDIVYLLFASKYFNEQDLSALASATRIMLPGMVCMLVSTVLTKLILCLNNSSYKALGIGLIWPILYFLGIYVFFDLGLLGAASSYSIAWLFLVILLLADLSKQTKESISGSRAINV
jgi:peptidoglycan biosynthesis protein MviN/MurJ (putative lipid II flippase)